MSFTLTDIKNKFTMLQDDFGPEDDGPAEAANSDAPEEVVVVDEPETEDTGTDEAEEPAPAEPSAPGDCEVSWFRLEGADMCEAFQYWKYVIQGTNVFTFFITITMNISAQFFMEYTLGEVTKDWNLPVDPEGYAFSIWGVIYFFMALFVIYQTLPTDWIAYLGGRRNDDMIFNQMNFIFALNMLCNAAWLPFFQSNTQWGFIVGWFLLAAIWITNTALMAIADHNEVHWLEIITVRMPFSLYSGWVTSAMILNTAYMLKSWGMTDDINRVRPLTGDKWEAWTWANFAMDYLTEEHWTIVMGWGAFIFYNLIAWEERNPVFGLVFAWAGAAILVNNATNKTENLALIINLGIVLGLHLISMFTLAGYIVFENLQPWYEPISFWNGGIFSLVDYSEMFSQIKAILTYPEEYLLSLSERAETV